MTPHRCRRVYRNGDTVLDLRSAEDVPRWLEANKEFRWGCALLIDGILKARGYYREDEIAGLETKYATDTGVTNDHRI